MQYRYCACIKPQTLWRWETTTNLDATKRVNDARAHHRAHRAEIVAQQPCVQTRPPQAEEQHHMQADREHEHAGGNHQEVAAEAEQGVPGGR